MSSSTSELVRKALDEALSQRIIRLYEVMVGSLASGCDMNQAVERFQNGLEDALAVYHKLHEEP